MTDKELRELGVGVQPPDPKTKSPQPIRRFRKPEPIAKPGEF